ncbi:MAG TPA: DUF192 domain-containing protein [Steroidobacteraceae bacterium]|nr:DUF192 domain-containing protein [Steroidobacteraceae bacterium]
MSIASALRLSTVALLILCCPATPRAAPSAATAVPLSAFPGERIAIETRSSFRRALFEAWRAESVAEREQGFMFVRDDQVRPDQAMIFIYEPPQHVAMWMKNTLLSLDILFVDRQGCIVTIKERAEPGSLATIESRKPVTLVVELKAGAVATHGIAIGDRVLRLDRGWPRTGTSCTR